MFKGRSRGMRELSTSNLVDNLPSHPGGDNDGEFLRTTTTTGEESARVWGVEPHRSFYRRTIDTVVFLCRHQKANPLRRSIQCIEPNDFPREPKGRSYLF